MRLTRAAMLLTTAAALAVSTTGCGQGPWQPAVLPPADSEVEALTPRGTYTVTFERRARTGDSKDVMSVVSGEGFVDFGKATDGADCESEYVISDTRAVSGMAKIRGVRTSGAHSFYQDFSDPAAPGSWGDIADPRSPAAPVNLLTLFAPAIIASDMSAGPAGNGTLCSIGMMPRFMIVDDGVLVFDPNRADAVIKATHGQWIAQLVDALGLTGRRRNQVASNLLAVSAVSYDELRRDVSITITPDPAGGFILAQTKKNTQMISMRFTPAPDRMLTPIDTPTYFETIEQRVKSEGLDKVLAELVG